MAEELTEGFKISRNRLIYFSGIGILLKIFPIDPESSLFGIKFQNLEPDSVSMIFFYVSMALFLQFIVRMAEEFPALKGGYAESFKRIKV